MDGVEVFADAVSLRLSARDSSGDSDNGVNDDMGGWLMVGDGGLVRGSHLVTVSKSGWVCVCKLVMSEGRRGEEDSGCLSNLISRRGMVRLSCECDSHSPSPNCMQLRG